MERKSSNFKKVVKGFPKVKSHLDPIIAILTILLTVTVLAQNWKILHTSQTTSNQSPQNPKTVNQTKIIQVTATPKVENLSPTPQSNVCTPGIGSISISSPSQNSSVNSNPVCISISYNQGNFCSSVWSYNINGGAYSSYGNDQPCFYNLPSGNTTFNLRVKSLVNSDTVNLTRDFNYSSTSAQLQ